MCLTGAMNKLLKKEIPSNCLMAVLKINWLVIFTASTRSTGESLGVMQKYSPLLLLAVPKEVQTRAKPKLFQITSNKTCILDLTALRMLLKVICILHKSTVKLYYTSKAPQQAPLDI